MIFYKNQRYQYSLHLKVQKKKVTLENEKKKAGENGTAFDQSIPSFNKNFNVYYVLGTTLDAGVTAMNKRDKG